MGCVIRFWMVTACRITALVVAFVAFGLYVRTELNIPRARFAKRLFERPEADQYAPRMPPLLSISSESAVIRTIYFVSLAAFMFTVLAFLLRIFLSKDQPDMLEDTVFHATGGVFMFFISIAYMAAVCWDRPVSEAPGEETLLNKYSLWWVGKLLSTILALLFSVLILIVGALLAYAQRTGPINMRMMAQNFTGGHQPTTTPSNAHTAAPNKSQATNATNATKATKAKA